MRKILLCALLLACGTAYGEDQVWTQQVRVLPPATDPKHVVTVDRLEAADAVINRRIDGVQEELDNTAHYDEDGNVSYPAGMALRVEMPDGSKHSVLATDTNGNAVFGSQEKQLNIASSTVPAVKVGDGETSSIVLENRLGEYVTEAELGAELTGKADLVAGVVPDSQIPNSVKVNYWDVPARGDLVTLVDATTRDIAFAGDNDPATEPAEGDGTYYLIRMPPTDLANWRVGNGGASGDPDAVVMVNGEPGPVVNIDLPNLPLVQNEFLDYARAETLVQYAKRDGAELTNTTISTPPANAAGFRVVNAEWTRALLTSNLGSVNPEMDGDASPGTATAVARSDHVHPTDSSRAAASITFDTEAPLSGGGDMSVNRVLAIAPAGAATATAAGTAGSAVYAPDNAAATVRDQAMTPAGEDAAHRRRVIINSAAPAAGATGAYGTLWLVPE